MKADNGVGDLEQALLQRAHRLADEYLERAQRARERIISEENDRLRLREERETLAAKALADRAYRRHVQRAELKLQEQLDQLRWELVSEVLAEVPAALAVVRADAARYRELLGGMLARAAAVLPAGELVCEMNSQDRDRLAGDWPAFAAQWAPERSVALAEQPRACGGGLLLRTADDRARVDDTFEGRLERLEEPLRRVIAEELFAGVDAHG